MNKVITKLESNWGTNGSWPLALVSCSYNNSFMCTSLISPTRNRTTWTIALTFSCYAKTNVLFSFYRYFRKAFQVRRGPPVGGNLDGTDIWWHLPHDEALYDTATALNSVTLLLRVSQLTVKYMCTRDLRSLMEVAHFISQTLWAASGVTITSDNDIVPPLFDIQQIDY